jgi:hypothetical protein
MKIELTKHAVKRAHQRLSLNKRAVKRTAELAIERGRATYDCLSNPWILGNQPSITSGREILAYGNAYYVFDHSSDGITLITVLLAKCESEGGADEYAV